MEFNVFAGHPWVQVDGVAPDKPLDSAVLTRLKQFSAMNKLKKMALRVRVSNCIITQMNPCVSFPLESIPFFMVSQDSHLLNSFLHGHCGSGFPYI